MERPPDSDLTRLAPARVLSARRALPVTPDESMCDGDFEVDQGTDFPDLRLRVYRPRDAEWAVSRIVGPSGSGVRSGDPAVMQ